MSPSDANVPDAELAVLEALWSSGPATKSELVEVLYPSGSDSYLATVQKLLERLEQRGLVNRDRSSFAHVFDAALSRDEFVRRQLTSVAARLSGGSLVPLIMHLVEGRHLSKRDRERLRRLLDEEDP